MPAHPLALFMDSSSRQSSRPHWPKPSAQRRPCCLCRVPCLQVASILGAFDSLLAQQAEVAARSRALASSCEALVADRERAMALAEALRTKLAFFEEFEAVLAQVRRRPDLAVLEAL